MEFPFTPGLGVVIFFHHPCGFPWVSLRAPAAAAAFSAASTADAWSAGSNESTLSFSLLLIGVMTVAMVVGVLFELTECAVELCFAPIAFRPKYDRSCVPARSSSTSSFATDKSFSNSSLDDFNFSISRSSRRTRLASDPPPALVSFSICVCMKAIVSSFLLSFSKAASSSSLRLCTVTACLSIWVCNSLRRVSTTSALFSIDPSCCFNRASSAVCCFSCAVAWKSSSAIPSPAALALLACSSRFSISMDC
mmetsp:Transcript_19142/g.54364  ORF Transcript_19142/g.54364 Transcript_19142/m.54364 type:complete len:251 (-) Transcript_19142:3989-4741(-)